MEVDGIIIVKDSDVFNIFIMDGIHSLPYISKTAFLHQKRRLKINNTLGNENASLYVTNLDRMNILRQFARMPAPPTIMVITAIILAN